MKFLEIIVQSQILLLSQKLLKRLLPINSVATYLLMIFTNLYSLRIKNYTAVKLLSIVFTTTFFWKLTIALVLLWFYWIYRRHLTPLIILFCWIVYTLNLVYVIQFLNGLHPISLIDHSMFLSMATLLNHMVLILVFRKVLYLALFSIYCIHLHLLIFFAGMV